MSEPRAPGGLPDPGEVLRDPARLASVRGTGLLDTSPEDAFDRLVRLAARALRAPVAVMTLLDERRQYFKSHTGVAEPWASLRETPLTHSFCKYVVGSGEPLVVADAREHPVLRASLAIPELGAVSYAGVPLRGEHGLVVGSLAVIDDHRREWTSAEVETLHDVAAAVTTEMEWRRDVRELRSTEARLAAAEEHYRRLVETSPYGIFTLDGEGRCTEVNAALAEILGHPASALMGRHFEEVTATADRDSTAAAFRRILAGEQPGIEAEVRAVNASGELRRVDVRAVPVRTGGRVAGVHGVVRDVTAEREREARTRLMAAALERLGEAVAITDREGRFRYANATHARHLGYPAGDFASRTVEEFLPGEAGERFAEAVAHARAHGGWSGRLLFRTASGAAAPMEVLLGRVADEAGEELLFVLARDVSDLVSHETQLRRAERLASLGTLLSGVAHELNNPLAAVRSFAQLLLLDERTLDDREALEIIEREAVRAAKIIADLRRVARQTQRDGADRAPVSLNEVVQHVLRLRGYTLATHNVEVRQDLAAGLPPVHADPGELEQVVLNLVLNAEHSLADRPGERRLLLRTRPGRLGVTLEVVDSGPGIPPEHLERIFDPFWTTREPGKGTGLGLSMVHSIVAEHGGEVRVESEPGRGAAFFVELPASPAVAGNAEGAGEGAAGGRALRVLVVDDEATIRQSLARYLARRGHEVEEAADGRDALRRVAAAAAPYDVILADLRMPGLSGDLLLAELRARHPGTERRLVFMTGDAFEDELGRGLGDEGIPVLLKPFELAEVARVLEKRAMETAR